MENVFEMIREKTEEDYLDSVLTSSFGGYSKKSVLEYFNQLRHQQQDQKSVYEKEIKRILSEKEKLKNENIQLKERVNTSEIEYDSLRNQVGVDGVDPTIKKQYEELKNEYNLLEKDMDEAIERIKSDDEKLQNLTKQVEIEKENALKFFNETNSLKETIKSMQDSVGNQGKVVVTQKDEIARLKDEIATLSSGNYQQEIESLKQQVEKLNANILLLQTELKAKDDCLKQKEISYEALNSQDLSNTKTIEMLQSAFANMSASNEELKGKLQEKDDLQKSQGEQIVSLRKIALAYKKKYTDLSNKLEGSKQS